MNSFKIYTQGDVLALVNKRKGETKIGEKVQTINQLAALAQSSAKFVLLGIPEDIGVRANYGIGGTQTAWKPALKAFLNLQENSYFKGENILVLGEFEIDENHSSDVDTLRRAVLEIDALVFPIIEAIVAAGKIPMVIGGGHNNCYPILKGASLALKTKLDVLNIDAHADLRDTEEGRHSGNGFSTAIRDGYIDQYRILGLQQQYLTETQQQIISQSNAIKAFYLDDLLAYQQNLQVSSEILLNGVKQPVGLEIDLDCISRTLASATTCSGFTLNEIRQLLMQMRKGFTYLHLCEGAYHLSDGRKDEMTGKTIAYLVSDFVKSFN